jgi:hypothetical protein
VSHSILTKVKWRLFNPSRQRYNLGMEIETYYITCLGLINRFQLGCFMRSLKVQQNGIQAYCYAAPGSTVEDDMVDQLCAFFEQFPAKSNPKAQPSLDPISTLYGASGLLAQGFDLIPDILPSHLAGNQRLQVSGVIKTRISSCGPQTSLSRLEPDDLEEIVEKLFEDGLEELYIKASARNFLLINVPPKDRSPSGRVSFRPRWNVLNVSA